jgi:hypothetical protein
VLNGVPGGRTDVRLLTDGRVEQVTDVVEVPEREGAKAKVVGQVVLQRPLFAPGPTPPTVC